MRSGTRKPVTFRFDGGILERARQQAGIDNRSLTNFVETAVLRALECSDELADGSKNHIDDAPNREATRK